MKTIYKALKTIEVPVSIIAAIIFWRVAAYLAYVDRGYDAIGGEFFVFPVVLIFMVCLFEKILHFINKEHKERI